VVGELLLVDSGEKGDGCYSWNRGYRVYRRIIQSVWIRYKGSETSDLEPIGRQQGTGSFTMVVNNYNGPPRKLLFSHGLPESLTEKGDGRYNLNEKFSSVKGECEI
jgi:hypothetical protein